MAGGPDAGAAGDDDRDQSIRRPRLLAPTQSVRICQLAQERFLEAARTGAAQGLDHAASRCHRVLSCVSGDADCPAVHRLLRRPVAQHHPAHRTDRTLVPGGGRRSQLSARLPLQPAGRRRDLRRLSGHRPAAGLRRVPRARSAHPHAGQRAVPAAGGAAAAGAGLRFHPGLLVRHPALAGQRLAAGRRPHRARPALLSAGGGGRHAAPRPACAGGGRRVARQLGPATLPAHRAARRCATRSSPV